MLDNLKRFCVEPIALAVRTAAGDIETRQPWIDCLSNDIEEMYVILAGDDDGTVLVRVEFAIEFSATPTARLLRFLCDSVFPGLVKEAGRRPIAIYSGCEFPGSRHESIYFWSANGREPGFTNLLGYLEKCEAAGEVPRLSDVLYEQFCEKER